MMMHDAARMDRRRFLLGTAAAIAAAAAPSLGVTVTWVAEQRPSQWALKSAVEILEDIDRAIMEDLVAWIAREKFIAEFFGHDSGERPKLTATRARA